MHIHRIDLAGYGPLTGAYYFPPNGVGVWAAPNDQGKSTLVTAVVTALYGFAPGDPETGSITIRFRLDSGEELTVHRDLTAGTVRVTDAFGLDLSRKWTSHEPPGERLLGFTREQFLRVVHLSADDVAATPGDPCLRAMLNHGRGHHAAPSDVAAPPAPLAPTDTPAEAAGGDLDIFHSPAEEMKWDASSFDTSDRVLSLDDAPLEVTRAGEPAGEPAATPTASAPIDETGPNAQLRSLKAQIGAAERHFHARNIDYQGLNDRLKELQAEQQRLGALDGAEPSDVERLQGLVVTLKEAADRAEENREEEQTYLAELAERGLDESQIRELDSVFRPLGEDDEYFLRNLTQFEALMRGNQALTRSESRLDESRIVEIDAARSEASRTAYIPLMLSMVALAAAVAEPFFASFPATSGVLLAGGLSTAGAGALFLYRAKRIREDERAMAVKALDLKRNQLRMFEAEADDALNRLASIATARSVENVEEVRRLYELHLKYEPEILQLIEFEMQTNDVRDEIVSLREQLGSFTLAMGDDPARMSDDELDSMVHDYIRHFTILDEIAEAERRVIEIEAELAEAEGGLATIRIRIGSLLEAEDIAADHDLDDAIQLHAQRAREREIEATQSQFPASPPVVAGTEGLGGGPSEELAEPADEPLEDAEWAAALSARTEAILRLFRPEARNVNVGSDLSIQLIADPHPEAAPVTDQELRALGSAAHGQVCLALRLAIVETLSAAGERVPVFLDEPFARADDARHDHGVRFLVEDASKRNQVVLLTSHEVRTRWYLHQHPQHVDLLRSLLEPANETPPAGDAPSAAPEAPPSEHSSPS